MPLVFLFIAASPKKGKGKTATDLSRALGVAAML
jgi:hypothetical protein